jgi:hypothetical protein
MRMRRSREGILEVHGAVCDGRGQEQADHQQRSKGLIGRDDGKGDQANRCQLRGVGSESQGQGNAGCEGSSDEAPCRAAA